MGSSHAPTDYHRIVLAALQGAIGRLPPLCTMWAGTIDDENRYFPAGAVAALAAETADAAAGAVDSAGLVRLGMVPGGPGRGNMSASGIV